MNDEQSVSTRRVAARDRFLAACSLAGAATTAYRGPEVSTEPQPYWIDIARLGSPDAPNVLVLSCGLNGAEGYCGSTIMTEWLSAGHQRDVPRDVGLIMLHAIIPAGYSAGGAAAPEHPPQRRWTDNVLSAAARRFATYAEAAGLKTELAPGPGDGREREVGWIAAASDVIAEEAIEHARHVAVLEFHTSLSPYGDVSVASAHPPASAASGRLKSWFGDEARPGEAAALDLFAFGFGARLADLTLTAAHVEFGAYTIGGVLGLDARRTIQGRHADARALFSPDTEAWRDHIASEGARLVGLALGGLAAS